MDQNGDLSGVLRRLLREQEGARQRLARELHQGSSQLLAAAQIELECLRQVISDESTRARLAVVAHQLATVSAEVGKVADRAYPATLEHLGLGAALSGLARGGVTVEVSGNPERHSPEVEILLYRFVADVVRKAPSERPVRVRLGPGLRLSVSGVSPEFRDENVQFWRELIRSAGCGMDVDDEVILIKAQEEGEPLTATPLFI